MSEVNRLLKEAEAAYEADDLPGAVRRFTALAEIDVIKACHFLGFIYKTEEGEFCDRGRSNFWYAKYLLLLRRAAEAGDLDGMLSLGKHYQYGDLVTADVTKARELFFRAANAGHVNAQFHLATLFLHGWCGCEKNDDAYLEWLDRAASGRHPEALFHKGRCLVSVCDAEEEGLALIRQSAELGFWVAQEYLESRDSSS